MSKKISVAVRVAQITLIGTIVVAVIGLISSVITKEQNPPAIAGASQEYIGRVLDANTLFPIPNAKITLDLEGVPPVVYTDSEGVYRFDAVIKADISGQVRVDAIDYQVYTRNISISPDDLKIDDIRLTPLPKTATAQPIPSITNTPEITNTVTVAPQPPTSTPLVVKTLADGCIFAQTWQADSTDSNQTTGITTKADGCYDTGVLGVFANRSGALQILDDNNRTQIASGIFMPINSDSIIEFRVHVDLMYIVTPGTFTYVNFAVASADDPMATKNTARFKLQVEDIQNDPFIYFVLADTGENYGARLTNQHYEYGRTYTIRLELVGSIMNVFINNIKQNDSPTIPAGAKVFYIGYNLPPSAGIDAEVTNIKVDGVAR